MAIWYILQMAIWYTYGHLVYFTNGHLVYFTYGHLVDFIGNFVHFGILNKEKSGNPAVGTFRGQLCRKSTYRSVVFQKQFLS
jgi:hypothetical protein